MKDDSDFWNKRYRSARVAWDAGGVPREAQEFIGTTKPGRILLPGCGTGYEVAAFSKAGWDVVGIEFSSMAIARARKTIGLHAKRIVFGDFFAVSLPEPFDVIYERAFLCAVPPDCWTRYITRVHELLRPAGLFAGYFYYGHDEEPPPYPLTSETAVHLLGSRFRREADTAAVDSVPVYADGERWQIWRKR